MEDIDQILDNILNNVDPNLFKSWVDELDSMATYGLSVDNYFDLLESVYIEPSTDINVSFTTDGELTAYVIFNITTDCDSNIRPSSISVEIEGKVVNEITDNNFNLAA